jgi:hypothetical protein
MGTSLEEQIAETMKQLLGDPHICAWSGCTNHFNGDRPPRGWVALVLSSSKNQRDAFLCPNHVAELEGQLKAVGDGSTT